MTNLAPYASKSAASAGRRYNQGESQFRNAYQRDHDRIIHARAFRKLQHKTQVFVSHEGDFHRTRLTHSLEVAQVTRTICRALNLNEDLGVTIALAHDLGHPPFGHTGEDALNACLEELGEASFDHNVQALRIITALESPYPEHPGLNLTWETLDGLAKHNGPIRDKSKQAEILELLGSTPFNLDQQPSLESQVSALCDDIAYNCHDVDDGLRAGLFGLDDLRELPMLAKWIDAFDKNFSDANASQRIYALHRTMITEMVNDVCRQTRANLLAAQISNPEDVFATDPLASFSDNLLSWLQPLREFLFAKMYRHPDIQVFRDKKTKLVKELFHTLWENPERMPPDWQKFEAPKAIVLIDYISGMTDRFAILQHADFAFNE